jgi:hypothetical protein
MLGGDKERGYCLEKICADFFAGAHLANDRNVDALYLALRRFFEFLPAPNKTELLDHIQKDQ